MISFPFDSLYNEGTSSYDRAIDSKIYAKMINQKFKNGVFPDAQDEFEVTAGTGLKVIVKKGSAMIQGRFSLEDENETELTLDAADTTYARIDRIILRMDDNLATRNITLMVLKGTAASTPVAPTLTRTQNVYDISLAKVTIQATAISINSDNIIDERSDASVCGWVSSVTGIVPIDQGGTASTTIETARTNLQVPYYEEGTWTPHVRGYARPDDSTYTSSAFYCRVGNYVHAQARVVFTAIGTSGAAIQVTGLPFASSAYSNGTMAVYTVDGSYGNVQSSIISIDSGRTSCALHSTGPMSIFSTYPQLFVSIFYKI